MMTPAEALEFATLIESSFEWPERVYVVGVAGKPDDLEILISGNGYEASSADLEAAAGCVHSCRWPSKQKVSVAGRKSGRRMESWWVRTWPR